MRIINKLYIGIGILIILSPLGLLLPEYFKAGSAWGEWGIDEIQKLAGYIPQGLNKLSNLWNAPLPDYTFKGWEGKGALAMSFTYLVSAFIGILAILAVMLLISKVLNKKK